MTSTLLLTGFALLPSSATLVVLVAVLAIAVFSVFAYTQMRTTGAPIPRAARAYGLSSRGRPSMTARSTASSYVAPDEAPPGARRRAAGLRAADGREYAIGHEAAIIGSSADACQIVLDGAGVAPEHARIWIRDGRCLLHHVGGMSRKTYVSNEEVEWVVLDPGDEVRIGSHRLVFDFVDASVPVAIPAKREPGIDEDLAKMVAAVRALWDEAVPASETAVGERSGTGKFKVHRRKEELAPLVGGKWVKRGRTVVLER